MTNTIAPPSDSSPSHRFAAGPFLSLLCAERGSYADNRAAALAIAFSEAVTMLSSRPTP
jgi:hypothetical protein